MAGKTEGLLLISIDCLPDCSSTSLAQERILASAASLVDLFAEFRLPASWAFARPSATRLTGRIMDQPVEHRIGLLAEPHWASPACGRTRYARELTRRIESAAADGIVVSTLALRELADASHLDLLVRNRLVVIRDGLVDRRKSFSGLYLHSERYGIWRSRPSTRIPGGTGWLSPLQSGPQQQLARRLARREVTHLLIDVPALAQRESHCWKRLRKMLGFVRRQIDAGGLTCVPVERLANHLRHDHHRMEPPRRTQATVLRGAA